MNNNIINNIFTNGTSNLVFTKLNSMYVATISNVNSTNFSVPLVPLPNSNVLVYPVCGGRTGLVQELSLSPNGNTFSISTGLGPQNFTKIPVSPLGTLSVTSQPDSPNIFLKSTGGALPPTTTIIVSARDFITLNATGGRSIINFSNLNSARGHLIPMQGIVRNSTTPISLLVSATGSVSSIISFNYIYDANGFRITRI